MASWDESVALLVWSSASAESLSGPNPRIQSEWVEDFFQSRLHLEICWEQRNVQEWVRTIGLELSLEKDDKVPLLLSCASLD